MLFTVDTKPLVTWAGNLRQFADDLPDVVSGIEQASAELVADVARPMVPHRTGAARDSVKAIDYSGSWTVVGGSASVRYYKWLNYGGGSRPKVRDGRYQWPAFEKSEQDVQELMSEKLLAALQDAGLA